ncbi:hypothetical protein NQ317_002792 [Molorchus minor]|uniref:GST N-terminal domain-containing protein n=1 Tax=Molorchus minor TaxID=1323400 RepID=A0ABQ9J6M4_9CUCU|nr:hypothetical protein NQ317_002792 [Molorchus minor]
MNSPHLSKGSKPPPPLRGNRLRLYSNRFCPSEYVQQTVKNAVNVLYDVVNINLSNKPDWLYDKNPLGKIPALKWRQVMSYMKA